MAARHARTDSIAMSGSSWLPPFGSHVQHLLNEPVVPLAPLSFVPVDWVQTTFPNIEPVKGGKLGQCREEGMTLSTIVRLVWLPPSVVFCVRRAHVPTIRRTTITHRNHTTFKLTFPFIVCASHRVLVCACVCLCAFVRGLHSSTSSYDEGSFQDSRGSIRPDRIT